MECKNSQIGLDVAVDYFRSIIPNLCMLRVFHSQTLPWFTRHRRRARTITSKVETPAVTMFTRRLGLVRPPHGFYKAIWHTCPRLGDSESHG